MSRIAARAPLGVALSQHSLRNSTIAERIVAASGLAPPDVVFEVGAGTGTLTAALAAAHRRVVAVERDPVAASFLRRRFSSCPTVEVIEADFLHFALPSKGRYAVAGNPPFSLTSPILRRLLGLPNPPARTVLVLPRDAALRWSGAVERSVVSVLTGARFTVELLLAIHRREFQPRPNIDAVLVAIEPRGAPPAASRLMPAFEQFLRRGFGRGPLARRNLGREVSYETFKAVARRHQLSLDVAPRDVPVSAREDLFLQSQSAVRHARPSFSPRGGARRAGPRPSLHNGRTQGGRR